MQDLDLSNNRLSSFTVSNIEGCNISNLSKLQLQDNHLRAISLDLFQCTKHLLHLNLARNVLTNEVLMEAGLDDLYELEYLILDGNNIGVLKAEMIGNMVRLHELSCRRCGMTRVEKEVFANVTNLHRLDLSKNALVEFEPHNTIPALTELYLSGNSLQKMSSFGGSWPGLQTLDLSRNEITVWEGNSIRGLYNLTTLRIANNNITHLSYYALISLLKLQFLDISYNAIQKVHSMAFIVPRFTNIYMDFNKIADLGTFLLTLQEASRLSLRGNRITRIEKNMIGLNSIEWLDFSQNMISYIESGSFLMPRLKFVNLTYNRIHHLASYALLANPGLLPKNRPEILLEGNFLHCDCNNEFLLKINTDM